MHSFTAQNSRTACSIANSSQTASDSTNTAPAGRSLLSEYNAVARYSYVAATPCTPTKYSLLRTDFHETHKFSMASCRYRYRILPKSVGKCGKERKTFFCPNQSVTVAGSVCTAVRTASQCIANKTAIPNLIKSRQTFLSQSLGHMDRRTDGRTDTVCTQCFLPLLHTDSLTTALLSLSITLNDSKHHI